MGNDRNNSPKVLTAIILFLAVALTGIIFIIDINVPMGVALGAMYCLVIFQSWLLPGQYASIYAAVVCTILVLIGVVLSYDVNISTSIVGINRIISLVAIWICAFLVIVAKRSFAALEMYRLNLEEKVLERTRELHEKQALIEQSEKKYRTFLEGAPDAIVVTNQNGKILLINQETEKLFGYSREELIGQEVEILIPKRYADKHITHRENYSETLTMRNTGIESELFGIKKNGEEFPAEIRLSPLKTDDGISISAAIRDISERKIIEEKLRLKQEQFRNAFEFSAIGMALVSTTGEWLDVNRHLSKMIGYTKEELLELTFQDITHPDDLESDLEQLTQLLHDEIDGYQMEKRYFHKKGHTIWVLLSVSLIRDKNNDPVHFVSQIENITKRKLAEEALQKASDRLTLAMQSSKIGIWEYDIENDLLEWDNTMFQIYGVDKESFSVVYENWSKNVHPEDMENVNQRVSLALAGKIDYNAEFRIYWPDQSIHHISANALVQRDKDGKPIRMVGTNKDITAEKKSARIERNITILKSKNKEMEQFTYVASHDLREPLLTIKNYTQLLIEDFSDQINQDARHFANSILKASGRMEELISGLLDYSRLGGNSKQLEEVNCQDTVTALLEDLESLIQKNTASIVAKDLPTISAYSLEMKLLFQNLIQNAIKFRKPNQQAMVWISARKVENGHEFCIKDNGIGIEKKHVIKIFTIFRKLHKKNEYQGSGIGLAHAKKIVELHNGEIWAESKLGVGSSFYFTILTES